MSVDRASARHLAVFSDIHANLHALQAVLADIDDHGIERLVCCGDVVGYGAFPNECVDLVRARAIPTLMGNHDHAAIGLTDSRYFNNVARVAIEWTDDRLTESNTQWLRHLPMSLSDPPDFLFVHAAPADPARWDYVLTVNEVRTCFSHFTQRICFIGHSHQATLIEQEGEVLDCPQVHPVPIREACRYLINVGSVGQPRDQDPEACWIEVNLCDETPWAEFHRVPYDVEAAQKAILEHNLPHELAERLGIGW